MKICIEKNLVKLTPESPVEVAELTKLWRRIISCSGISKKLSPVGDYIPGKEKSASFYIEGLTEEEAERIGNFAEEPGTYYCNICNKSVKLAEGEEIPLCCGKRMEFVG